MKRELSNKLFYPPRAVGVLDSSGHSKFGNKQVLSCIVTEAAYFFLKQNIKVSRACKNSSFDVIASQHQCVSYLFLAPLTFFPLLHCTS